LTTVRCAEFWKDYGKLPADIRTRAEKQFSLLKENPQHPRLHFKKLRDRSGQEIWSARVTLKYPVVADTHLNSNGARAECWALVQALDRPWDQNETAARKPSLFGLRLMEIPSLGGRERKQEHREPQSKEQSKCVGRRRQFKFDQPKDR